MKLGRFITLEGGEGVGKTTNLGFIEQLLRLGGNDVVVTREPGGTVVAEKIRALLLDRQAEAITGQAELLMMFAARAQHLHHVIRPALQQGQWVLCDRFTDATYAYQGGGRKVDSADIAWLETRIQAGLQPDLTLLLDAPVDIGMQRAKKRGELDRFESERKIFFEEVRQNYLQRAQACPGRICVIDASRSLACVQQAIRMALESLMP